MGNIYGSRLLDPFDVQNKKKWEELHDRIVADENKEGEKEIISVFFKATSVPHPFAEENEHNKTSLNKICKSYYEKEIEETGDHENSKIKIGDDNWKAVWMLCSM